LARIVRTCNLAGFVHQLLWIGRDDISGMQIVANLAYEPIINGFRYFSHAVSFSNVRTGAVTI